MQSISVLDFPLCSRFLPTVLLNMGGILTRREISQGGRRACPIWEGRKMLTCVEDEDGEVEDQSMTETGKNESWVPCCLLPSSIDSRENSHSSQNSASIPKNPTQNLATLSQTIAAKPLITRQSGRGIYDVPELEVRKQEILSAGGKTQNLEIEISRRMLNRIFLLY